MTKHWRIAFAFFTYTGNSTGTSLMWPIADWWARLACRLKSDYPNVEFWANSIADTPVCMSRNRAVKEAKASGADLLIMVDSDITPDVRLGSDPEAVPFFDTAFKAVQNHYERGPIVVAAPYGGAPPNSNQFVFTFSQKMNSPESSFELRQYTREEAASFSGLHNADALPTGLIMYDLRAFDYINPPWFHYEWTDEYETEKASTEDVQNTRDIGIAIQDARGCNPLFCAWSSWAGHNKVWCVDKPAVFTMENVADRLGDAIRKNRSVSQKQYDVGAINRLRMGLPEVATNGQR